MRAARCVLFTALLLPGACSASGEKDNNLTKPGGNGDDGGGINADGGGINTDGGDPGTGCGETTYDGKKVPASVLIVFDRSASMDKPPVEGGSGPTKWVSSVSAMKAALTKADDALPVGLLFYPEGKFDTSKSVACFGNPTGAGCPEILADNGCQDIRKTPDVAVAPLATSRTTLRDALDNTDPEGDNTPTRWALKNAWAHMKTVDAKGDRYVLLVTDGVPTTYMPKTTFGPLMIPESGFECKDQATIEAEAGEAANGTPSVKTFVIGSPGSEKAAPHLSKIALNGKAPRTPTCNASAGECHYAIGTGAFEADLAKAIEEITGKIATCIFEVPTGMDVDPNKVNVSVGGQNLFQDPNNADGWNYTDATKTRVEIFGAKCDEIKANAGSAAVKVMVGCITRVR